MKPKTKRVLKYAALSLAALTLARARGGAAARRAGFSCCASAAAWADEAAARGVHLWVSSHCVACCGYLSPGAYCLREPEGYSQFHEWRLMNWFGPDQEALYAALKHHIPERLFPDSQDRPAAGRANAANLLLDRLFLRRPGEAEPVVCINGRRDVA